MLTSEQVKEMTIGLFNQESERDKQRKVGASQISDPCTRHLAHALIGSEESKSKYWLGGKLGTALHSYLESAIAVSNDDRLNGAIVERKITLGNIDKYGIVSSKPDLVLTAHRALIDWKSSTRKKTTTYQKHIDGIKIDKDADYTLQKYIAQTMLYAWGLWKEGIEIDDIFIVFVNRDGTNENDIWPYRVPYVESLAVQLWERLENLWLELEAGAHPDSYPATPGCFKCAIGI